MAKISQEKIEGIKKQILGFLNFFPGSFTYQVGKGIYRDEEFTLKLLKQMEDEKKVIGVRKNKEGKAYRRRIEWRLK